MLPDNQALCDHKRSPSLPRPLLGGSREPRLGLVEEVEGDVPGALRRLEVARQCAARTTDCYVWIEAYALEALAGVAIRAQSRRAVEWVEDLRSLAARTGMREMAAQAYLYKFELGDEDALDGARVMAAETQNPALAAKLTAI